MKCTSKEEYNFLKFTENYPELFKFVNKKLISFHEFQPMILGINGLVNLYRDNYIVIDEEDNIEIFSEDEFNKYFKIID